MRGNSPCRARGSRALRKQAAAALRAWVDAQVEGETAQLEERHSRRVISNRAKFWAKCLSVRLYPTSPYHSEEDDGLSETHLAMTGLRLRRVFMLE